jgi:hypothetical protein
MKDPSGQPNWEVSQDRCMVDSLYLTGYIYTVYIETADGMEHVMSIPFDEYAAGQFAGLANTPFGKKAWKFLSSAEIVRDMETGSELGHPAVASIEERLLEEFGKDVLEDRTKQMLGHMVRQIMEKRGFVIDQQNVTIGSVPFSKGTRYRRPTWYRVHVFRNSKDFRDICFSAVRTGAKLPNIGNGKWQYSSSFATRLRAAIAFDIQDFDALRKELEEKGFKRGHQARILRAAN